MLVKGLVLVHLYAVSTRVATCSGFEIHEFFETTTSGYDQGDLVTFNLCATRRLDDLHMLRVLNDVVVQLCKESVPDIEEDICVDLYLRLTDPPLSVFHECICKVVAVGEFQPDKQEWNRREIEVPRNAPRSSQPR